jgi:hypothetical protein
VGIDEDSEEVKIPRESSEHFVRRYWNWEGLLGCSFLVAIYSMRMGCEAAVRVSALNDGVKRWVTRCRTGKCRVVHVFAWVRRELGISSQSGRPARVAGRRMMVWVPL